MGRHRTGTLYRRGEVWWLKYVVDGRVIAESLGTKDLAAAETIRAEKMRPLMAAHRKDILALQKQKLEDARQEHATAVELQYQPLLLTEAFAAYLKAPNRPDSGPSTLRQYESEWKRFLAWMHDQHPGISQLQELSPAVAGAYAAHLAACHASPSTFNQHVGFSRLLWTTLQKDARLPENPWDEIKRKRLVTNTRRELTVDELRRVCQTAQGEMRLLFALGLYTGMRLGDCCTLQWGEVDVKRGVIQRVPMKVARRRNVPVLIPIHPVLRGLLEETIPGARIGAVLPGLAVVYRRDSSAIAKQVQAHFLANGIRTRRADAGASGRAAVEVGFHSLRHSFVSLCREANAPLAVVEAIVGHSSPAMTRHYTHISEAAAGQAVAALPAVIGSHPDLKHDAPRAPLPAWAVDKLRDLSGRLTARTWKSIRDELEKMAGSAV